MTTVRITMAHAGSPSVNMALRPTSRILYWIEDNPRKYLGAVLPACQYPRGKWPSGAAEGEVGIFVRDRNPRIFGFRLEDRLARAIRNVQF